MSASQLVEINNLIITEFSKTVEIFDLPPVEARLFSILYLENTPMTLDQMSEALGKSKTSISTGIRNLLESNLVQRVWIKGVRKDLYTANENLYNKFMNSFLHKRIDTVNRQKDLLKQIESRLEEEAIPSKEKPHSDELEGIYSRLREMITFNNKVEQAFKKIKNNSSQ
ncbi:transcriptional regulator [Aquibacillus halophilus]|uniref:HTH-type transcriptional regulator n=1 Tax=Aquibacillus halophilus TaxID=930132 RepID=A0A6A8DM86_9BACI|nr:transcriptional regulator [Aquibacillus halophilus]MRH44127.1 transcriptional regulator [Aquibacillus halophilus]